MTPGARKLSAGGGRRPGWWGRGMDVDSYSADERGPFPSTSYGGRKAFDRTRNTLPPLRANADLGHTPLPPKRGLG